MRARQDAGSLLMITLWLVAVLAALAVAIARYLSLEVKLTKYRLVHEQAKTLARSGVYLAMQRLARDAAAPEADGKAYDWLGDDWASVPNQDSTADPRSWIVPPPAAGPVGMRFTGTLSIRIVDEAGRLHLNTVAKDQLVRLTGNEAIAQAVIDARDEPDAAEDSPDATPPYVAKNGPFIAPEELSDLPGMTREAYETLRVNASPYLLVEESVNLNTATPETLRALGLNERTVEMVIQFRDGPDGPERHEQDGVFKEAGLAILQTLRDAQGVDLTGTHDGNRLITDEFGVASNVFTVTSESVMERPVARCRVEAVIRRTACGEGRTSPCIIAWREH